MSRRETILASALLFAIAATAIFSYAYRRKAWESGLRADSIAAANDRTRQVAIRAAAGYASYERRVLQVRRERDAIDTELRRETRARVQAQLKLADFLGTIASTKPVEVAGDTRIGRFAWRDPPFTIRATASLPAPPGRGRLELGIMLDTLRLEARLQCGERDRRTGVAPASILLMTPVWAQVRIDSVQQAPEVCSPPPAPALSLPSLRLPSWVQVAVPAAAGVAGYLLGRRNR